MSKVKVKLNEEGVRTLLKSPEVAAHLQEKANAALGRLGGGYAVSQRLGRNRVNVSIKAVTRKARKENRDHNTILKAVMGK